jgi:hypothetical protein
MRPGERSRPKTCLCRQWPSGVLATLRMIVILRVVCLGALDSRCIRLGHLIASFSLVGHGEDIGGVSRMV